MGLKVLWLHINGMFGRFKKSIIILMFCSAKGHVFGQTSTAGGECVGRGVDVVVFAGEAAERNGTESAKLKMCRGVEFQG